MPEVLGRARQRLTSVLAAFAVLAFAVLPPEHIHVARIHDGHHSDVLHRHFEPHHRAATHAAVNHADEERNVQWLTASFTHPNAARQVAPDNQRVEHALSIPGPELTARGTVQPLVGPVHDPPWAISSGLRAPPTVLI